MCGISRHCLEREKERAERRRCLLPFWLLLGRSQNETTCNSRDGRSVLQSSGTSIFSVWNAFVAVCPPSWAISLHLSSPRLFQLLGEMPCVDNRGFFHPSVQYSAFDYLLTPLLSFVEICTDPCIVCFSWKFKSIWAAFPEKGWNFLVSTLMCPTRLLNYLSVDYIPSWNIIRLFIDFISKLEALQLPSVSSL